jgi:hypothetical protein
VHSAGPGSSARRPAPQRGGVVLGLALGPRLTLVPVLVLGVGLGLWVARVLVLGVGLGLWVALVLVLGVGLGLRLGLTLTTGPAPPVGLAGIGGALPQAVTASAMLAASTEHRTCVLRTECSRITNALPRTGKRKLNRAAPLLIPA